MTLYHIIVMVDTSFSMAPYIFNVAAGINILIKNLQKSNPSCYVSIVWFHEKTGYIVKSCPVLKCPIISTVDFIGSGMTCLYDSVTEIINEWSGYPCHKVSLYIISDGDDNMSCIYTKKTVEELCKKTLRENDWKIIHCGTNACELLSEAENVVYDISGLGALISNLTIN